MGNKVRKSREIIWKAFMDDPEFHNSYVANIAVLLYDKFPGLGMERANKIAVEILARIFS